MFPNQKENLKYSKEKQRTVSTFNKNLAGNLDKLKSLV